MKPSIGRIVHYHTDGHCEAAIITQVGEDELVTLQVFTPGGGNESPKDVPHHEGEDREEGSWHSPERVG